MTSALKMGVGGQHHAPAALPPGKPRYPLYRRLGGPQGQFGRVRKISPSPGFDPRTVQPVASSYTNWAIPVPVYLYTHCNTMHGAYNVKPFSFVRANISLCVQINTRHYIVSSMWGDEMRYSLLSGTVAAGILARQSTVIWGTTPTSQIQDQLLPSKWSQNTDTRLQ